MALHCSSTHASADPFLDCQPISLPSLPSAGVAGQNPVFEPTARLAKRWVGAHLLSPHLQEEAVELLLAHVFTAPTAPPPGSRLSGLLRFLTLLAEHPWRVQPLIVDPAGELSGAQREALLRQHAAQRAACSTVPMCLATPKDPTGDAWTSGPCPSSQVLHRIVVLAQRSAAALDQLLLGSRVRRPAGSEGGKKGRAVAARKTAAPSPPAALDIAAMLAALNGPASSDGSGGSGVAVAEAIVAPDPATPDPAEAVLAERVAATEAALASVFGRDLGEYDALVRLRTEGLPNAGNDLRLAGDASGASQRPALGPTLRAANQQLAALAAAASAAPSAKRSYAILKGIPRSECGAGMGCQGRVAAAWSTLRVLALSHTPGFPRPQPSYRRRGITSCGGNCWWASTRCRPSRSCYSNAWATWRCAAPTTWAAAWWQSNGAPWRLCPRRCDPRRRTWCAQQAALRLPPPPS